MFGYFAGRRGVGCSLLGAGCNLRGAGHGLRGAGCEMLSLISELQTCQLDLFLLTLSRFIDTKMFFSCFVALYFAN